MRKNQNRNLRTVALLALFAIATTGCHTTSKHRGRHASTDPIQFQPQVQHADTLRAEIQNEFARLNGDSSAAVGLKISNENARSVASASQPRRESKTASLSSTETGDEPAAPSVKSAGNPAGNSAASPTGNPMVKPAVNLAISDVETGLATRAPVAENSEPEQQLDPQEIDGPLNDTAAAAPVPAPAPTPVEPLKKLKSLESSGLQLSHPNETPLIFDIPVTYNSRVRNWIRYFQTEGRATFKYWLERSSRFLPVLQYELSRAGLPQDLVYVAMIESGFTPSAASHAGAMGMWQFIAPTARRYSLKIDWWIDERRDFHKATQAAIRYMRDLHQQFNSWYLVAASYNMGENGVRRLIQRHHTNNFWELAERGALPEETSDYVPKIIAAMLISKAPALYGFRDLDYQMPLSFESISAPGGTDIVNLATYLGVSEKYLKDLNPELIKGYIPPDVRAHKIRVPKGSVLAVSQFIRLQARRDENRSDRHSDDHSDNRADARIAKAVVNETASN